jgi:divalent metal cation (Fe/Co/Zn/Cd) transporter
MFEYIISQIDELTKVARDNYGVNPIIFIIIYLFCVPIFYYSLFRTLRALTKKLGNEIMLWSAIFLCANIAPFLYVLLFGRNIPWWVYGIIAIVISQGVLSLIIKLRKKSVNDLILLHN